jgi:hypothetical protein
MIKCKIPYIGFLLAVLISALIALTALSTILGIKIYRDSSGTKNLTDEDSGIRTETGSLAFGFRYHVIELIARGGLMHL